MVQKDQGAGLLSVQHRSCVFGYLQETILEKSNQTTGLPPSNGHHIHEPNSNANAYRLLVLAVTVFSAFFSSFEGSEGALFVVAVAVLSTVEGSDGDLEATSPLNIAPRTSGSPKESLVVAALGRWFRNGDRGREVPEGKS